jgi:hypothetical protein
MKKLLLTTVALLAMSAAATAATISFTASEDAGPSATINTGQTSASVGPISPAVTPDFTFLASGSTQGFTPPPTLLNAQNVTVSTTDAGVSHTLHLEVDATGIVGISGLVDFLSHFDVTGQTGTWTTSAFTDINGVVLRSAGPFTGVSTGADFFDFASVTDPFNVSAHWDITTNGTAGSTNLGIVLSTGVAQPVPGPIVGAGLPGLVSLLGYGWYWRRKRRVA